MLTLLTHTHTHTHTDVYGSPASQVAHQQSGMADDAAWERQVPEK